MRQAVTKPREEPRWDSSAADRVETLDPETHRGSRTVPPANSEYQRRDDEQVRLLRVAVREQARVRA